MSITVHTTHFTERPDCTGRLEKEQRVYDLLRARLSMAPFPPRPLPPTRIA